MLKILALFAVASAEVGCAPDAIADIFCKNTDSYVGRCKIDASNARTCTLDPAECATPRNVGDTCGGPAPFTGKCEGGFPARCKVPVSCPTPPTVPNGTITCTDAQKQASSGEKCTLNCDDTYYVKQSAATECNAAGAWAGSVGECEKVPDCANAEHPSVVNGTLDCSDVLAPGSAACTLTCTTGTKVQPTRTCTSAGAWTGHGGECEALTPCEDKDHPTVANATFDCKDVLNPNSDPCKLNCAAGYKEKTPTGRKCSAAGKWEGVAGDCEEVSNCANTGHPTVTNGTLDCKDSLAPGSAKCKLTCATKYKIKTATGRMCSTEGAWTGVAGACESDHAAAISIAAAIVVAVFALH